VTLVPVEMSPGGNAEKKKSGGKRMEEQLGIKTSVANNGQAIQTRTREHLYSEENK